MADETLLSASRRVVRFFNIDMNHGGLISVGTQQAIETLDKYVRLEAAREKAEADAPAEGPKLVVTLVPGTEEKTDGA